MFQNDVYSCACFQSKIYFFSRSLSNMFVSSRVWTRVYFIKMCLLKKLVVLYVIVRMCCFSKEYSSRSSVSSQRPSSFPKNLLFRKSFSFSRVNSSRFRKKFVFIISNITCVCLFFSFSIDSATHVRSQSDSSAPDCWFYIFSFTNLFFSNRYSGFLSQLDVSHSGLLSQLDVSHSGCFS